MFLVREGSVAVAAVIQTQPDTAGSCSRQQAEQPKAAGTEPAADHPGPAERYPRYTLRQSDVLQLTFPISPEYDQTVTIQPDGFVSLRGVGSLHVAGMSVPQTTEALKKAYGQFLHDPVITIELKEFEKPYFIAGGQFGKPGKYELRGDTTVAEAVAIAGGFTDKAKHSEVVLYRRIPAGWVAAKRLNMKQMLASNDLSEDLHLRSGDMIYVPQNALSKVRQFIPNTGVGLSFPF